MNYKNLNDIKTGDTLFFSNNGIVGNLIKITNFSIWHHIGIAVRVSNGKIKRNKGELYVLEISPSQRYDYFNGKYTKGISLTPIYSCLIRYNIISYRSIIYLKNKHIIKFTIDFINSNQNSMFANFAKSGFLILFNRNNNNKDLFCSNMVAKFYNEYYGKEIYNKHYNNIVPSDLINKESIFVQDELTNLYDCKSDLFSSVLQPIIIIVFFILLVYMIIKKY